MKITVEFDNLKEIEDFCNGVVIAPGLAQACRKENAEAATEAKEAPKAKKSTPKKAEAQEEAKTEALEPPQEVDNEVPLPAKEEIKTKKDKAPQEVDNEEPLPAKKEKKAAGHSEGDLKLLLSDKLKAGKKAEVKKLFEKYGVTCLTALFEAQKDNLDAVYEEAEGI